MSMARSQNLKPIRVRVADLHRSVIDELFDPTLMIRLGHRRCVVSQRFLTVGSNQGRCCSLKCITRRFENAEWVEHHYPGDFIVEYLGQTRGWFYTMHVLATALDRPAFSNCVSHGIVLGDDGAKMSKSLNNYPDPNQMFEVYLDAMRWYLSSPILRGSDFSVTETECVTLFGKWCCRYGTPTT